MDRWMDGWMDSKKIKERKITGDWGGRGRISVGDDAWVEAVGLPVPVGADAGARRQLR